MANIMRSRPHRLMVAAFHVYPKVKVRQEEDPPEIQRIYMKDFQSLSLYDHPSDSPDAKISARADKVNRKVAEQNKPSLVLRPRAVLSSPENDAMLGTKNKTKTQHSGLKNHNLCQNRHVKCKKSYELHKRSSSWEQ